MQAELLLELFFVFLHQALGHLVSSHLGLVEHRAVVRGIVPKVRQEKLGGTLASFVAAHRLISGIEECNVLFDHFIETKLGLLIISFR